MNQWLFFDYIDERDTNPIEEWLMDKKVVPTKARAKINVLLLRLAGTERWKRPETSNLDGYPGIIEIRIRWMNTQYRLLGFRGPSERQFSLLVPAVEKDDEFVPLNAPNTASKRMIEIIENRRRISEHRFH
ncbi:MAG: hypothetical protein WBF25_08640 [Terriglobales bacterium]